MSTMYPSLEDMKVSQIQQAQMSAAVDVGRASESAGAVALSPQLAAVYPSLMDDYMGLRLQPPSGPLVVPTPTEGRMVAPLSGADAGLARAAVSHGLRQVTVCKNADGKVGMRLRDVNKGVFVQFVARGSAAALAGVRFGDQLLQVDGADVAGLSADKAMQRFRKAADPQRIVLAIRDRPFERTMTLHKDSAGHVGFTHKDGRITNIVKDSSAARNGLLIEHNILEVNGQNSIGLKDNELYNMLNNAGQIVTITIMPTPIYQHMVKSMSSHLLRKEMDHSIPDV